MPCPAYIRAGHYGVVFGAVDVPDDIGPYDNNYPVPTKHLCWASKRSKTLCKRSTLGA